MKPERISALRRWAGLLNAARPGDVPVVLAGLSEGDLVAVVEVADAPVSIPVCEYVLAHGSTPALIALARRAVLRECDEGQWILNASVPRRRTGVLNRVLSRRDADIDAAFFDFDDSLKSIGYVRRSILSYRRGRDGRASIPPPVKQRLLDAAAEHAAHATQAAQAAQATHAAHPTHPDGNPLPSRLLSQLAGADDADLVLAALPYHKHLTAQENSFAVATLVAHGRAKEAMERYPELWSAFSRTARRAARRKVRRAAQWYSGPAGPAALSRGEYIKQCKKWKTRRKGGSQLRLYAQDALRSGTVTAAEAVAHSRPATVALTLACCTDRDHVLPGARRAASEIHALISEQLAARVGDDPEHWAILIDQAARFRGRFPKLLANLDRGLLSRSPQPYYGRTAPDPWNATNILFAMAPPDVATSILHDTTSDRQALHDHLAEGAPLTRQLVEHIMRDGTAEQRAALAANDATPDSVLARLLEHKELVHIIAERRHTAPELHLTALLRLSRDTSLGSFSESIKELTKYGPEPLLRTLRNTTDLAQLVSIVEAAAGSLQPDARLATYGILAELVGPEAVWALELDRAGSLEKMAPEVRASMASGTSEALSTGKYPRPGDRYSASGPADVAWRGDARLDHPFAHPLETLVQTHLDGRPERWLALADLLTAEPDADVQDLIARVAAR